MLIRAFDRLKEQLSHCEETVVLDPPGQPELMQHHLALPRILQRLEKVGYRVRSPPDAYCHVIDAAD